MKQFVFTVDDNVRFLRELTEGSFEHPWEHPYLKVYHTLHRRYGLKVQLNLFYRENEFSLDQVTPRYRRDFEENADWLKFSFHSELENRRPYEFSGYDEVFAACSAVHREILRFAGAASLAETTTIHYCRTSSDGLCALRDCGVRGLLGLFGTKEEPRSSYSLSLEAAERLREGEILSQDGLFFASIDLILNRCKKEETVPRLRELLGRDSIRMMIHEQYFYPDYPRYQPDFAQKTEAAVAFLSENGYQSIFLEEEARA